MIEIGDGVRYKEFIDLVYNLFCFTLYVVFIGLYILWHVTYMSSSVLLN